MSDFLSETEGCDLLARLFRARGYTIVRNLPFHEYGVEFHIDGWDAQARVGFEFLSSEDDDHDDLSLAEYQVLAAAQQRGELALFIIDEVEPLSVADLQESVNEFLDEVAEARLSRPKITPARKAAVTNKTVTKKTMTNKTATNKTATNKTATNKKPVAGKKSAAKRPAAVKKKAATTRAGGLSRRKR
jgi:hypothetical protein